MKHITTFAASLAALALAGGVALAQDTSGSMSNGSSTGAASSDSMSSGAMSPKMSKMDMETMKSCQAMDHDAMMKAGKCKKFMAKHPDMFNADGTMKSGMSPQ